MQLYVLILLSIKITEEKYHHFTPVDRLIYSPYVYIFKRFDKM